MSRSATDIGIGRTVEILIAGREWVKGNVVTAEQAQGRTPYLVIEMHAVDFMPLPDKVVVAYTGLGKIWRYAEASPPRDITPREQPHAAIEDQGSYASERRQGD